MKTIRLLVSAFVVCAMICCSAAANADSYSGQAQLYVATGDQRKARPAPPDELYRGPANGIYIQLLWNELQPTSPYSYDWTTLDRVLDKALPTGKNLSIGVSTGAHAPGWLESLGSHYVDLRIERGSRLTCVGPLRFFLPWEATYVSSYVNMMQSLARRLREKGAIKRVKVVKASIFGRLTTEMRLPSQNACGNDQSAAWVAAGYRPQKILAAWRTATFSVARYFPSALIAQDVLGGNDFPMINDDGTPAADAHPESDGNQVLVKDRIIRFGLRVLGNRFIVQWNALNLPGYHNQILDYYARSGAKLAWQTNLWGGDGNTGCNDTRKDVFVGNGRKCRADEYLRLLTGGLMRGGKYIEVWLPDVLLYPDVIMEVQKHGIAPERVM